MFLKEDWLQTLVIKLAAIATLPIPTIVMKVEGNLGYTSYCRKFIFRCTIIVIFKTKLLKKLIHPSVWTLACINAFNTLKRKLVTTPILIPLHWNKDFYICVNASIMAIGFWWKISRLLNLLCQSSNYSSRKKLLCNWKRGGRHDIFRKKI